MTSQNFNFGQRIRQTITAALIAFTVALPAANAQSNAASSRVSLQASQYGIATPKREKLTHEQIADRLKHSTCHIMFRRGRGMASGTGWVVDVNQRLIVTNHHVVDNKGPADRLEVYFPVKVDDKWQNNYSYYQSVVKPIKATVIATSRHHDLALVQLASLPANAKPLPLAADSPVAGSQLHSIGGKPMGTTTMWIYSYGRVRGVGQRPNAYRNISRMVECQLSVNKGNSGGPIVNDFGEVVAVVEGGEFNPLVKGVTYHVDVQQLKVFLKTGMTLVAPKTVDGLLARAANHMSDKRYQDAVRDYSAAVRMNPNSATVYAKRGMAFYRKGDARTAKGDFDQAIQLDPATADAYYGRGMIHRTKKNYADAIAEYTKAIRYEPSDARYYNARGFAEIMNNDVDASYSDFVEATKLDATQALYFANRGYTARLVGKYADSVDSYKKALQLGNTSYLSYINMGRSQAALKQYKDALRTFVLGNNAYKKRTGKENWQCFYYTGVVFFEQNELQKAYGVLSKALSLSPKNADIHAMRGKVAKKFGDSKKAAADFAAAAKLNPKKYGNLVAQSTGSTANGNTGSTTQVSRTTSSSIANSPVIGTWVVSGTSNGTRVTWVAIFAKDGSYATRIQVTNAQGTKKTDEYGRFTILGSNIVMTSSTGKKTTRRFALQNGKLGLYLTQYKKWLFYNKKP